MEEAIGDLSSEWSSERRKRWVLDIDTPADDGMSRRPNISRQATRALLTTRLEEERDAVV